MAIVYRALDTILNRFVSVKVLRAQFVSDEDFIRRFRREAQAAASLSHPNVVNIYDVGMEDDIYYIVMEYINGKTLKEIIQERAPLPVSEAVDVAKQICHALQHAHEHQIVHRDIKPHNILVGKDGHVKVTDFGIARAVTSNTITHNGSVLGSVHYFSPEQARGGVTDVRSDTYSLGVVMYEMLTGELPFTGESPISVALKHLQENFVDPREINPKIPQSVENVILKALAKDPEARYQTAKDMYRDLDKALLAPNAEKFVPPDYTAYTQPTISIPAAAFQDQAASSATARWNTAVPQQEPQPVKKKKRSFWKTLGLVIGILLLSGVGIAAGFMLMTGTFTSKEVQMPNVQGMPYEDAVNQLKRSGFSEKNIQRQDKKDQGSNDSGTYRPPYQAGIVFDQDPKSGNTVKTGRKVTLTVSSGPDQVEMPKLEGLTEKEAKDALSNLHFDLSKIKFTTVSSKDVEKGRVVKQSPSQLVPINPGQEDRIEVSISAGPEMTTVPNLQNLTLEQAVSKLQAAGLKLGQTARTNSNLVPANMIFRQSQDPGLKVPQDTSIDVWVSLGPEDMQTRPYQVDVKPQPGKPVVITIKKTDAMDTDKLEVDKQTVSSPQKFTFNVYVTPSKKGTIWVYQDGQEIDKKVVEYSKP